VVGHQVRVETQDVLLHGEGSAEGAVAGALVVVALLRLRCSGGGQR
jgi:hypothetical protein